MNTKIKKYRNVRANVYRFLREQPKARERSNKNRALANLIMRRFVELREMDKDIITKIVEYTITADRDWRWILERHEELRGSDYGEKKKLEQEKLIELGYNTAE